MKNNKSSRPQESWLLGVSVGWEGGVHVQSCGHHLHLRCLQAYLRSLAAPQRPHNLHVDRGEYLCPVCRQLANRSVASLYSHVFQSRDFRVFNDCFRLQCTTISAQRVANRATGSASRARRLSRSSAGNAGTRTTFTCEYLQFTLAEYNNIEVRQ